jgi:hypothetical protein
MENLKGKTIANVIFQNGTLIIETTDGFEISANGGNMDSTYMQVVDNNGNLLAQETQTF